MAEKIKVVLGMSGGVDSSVAAHLLQKQGYEVRGFFMNANVSGKSRLMMSISWSEEEKMVRKICEILGIQLHVVDCEKGYAEHVIGPMFEDYKKGLTPNPDTLCNKIGKFPKMWKYAQEIGAKYVATGHYTRVRKGRKGYELLMGKDKSKDQSYFLVDLQEKDLRHILFPIGEMTKTEVREIARKRGFPNWDKRGSRGICYLGKIDMKKFLRERIPEKVGKVVDSNGKVIGHHPGVMYFTIGEKVGDAKGAWIDRAREKWSGEKLYVAAKLKGNKLVVAPSGDKSLLTKRVLLKGFHWINEKDKETKGLKARIRHLGKLYAGKLQKKNGKWFFVFQRGVEGVAPGQMIALYKGEKMVCAGEIRAYN